MQLLSHIFPWNQRSLDRLAVEIARRCRDEVGGRLSCAALAMTPNEARGYVRSRAAKVIRREADAALERRELRTESNRRELVRQATDWVTPLVIHELSARRAVPADRKAG